MWRIAAITLLTTFALTGAGCDIFDSCTDRQRTVEVEWGSLTEDLDLLHMQNMERAGWDCQNDGQIRNAAGNVIGTRYRCTICD
jgi:hypothetical protein